MLEVWIVVIFGWVRGTVTREWYEGASGMLVIIFPFLIWMLTCTYTIRNNSSSCSGVIGALFSMYAVSQYKFY